VCQSNIFTVSAEQEELFLEDVSHVAVTNGQVTMRTLFGEPVTLEGRIKEVDLVKNRILIATD
jgi:predicted RNA-binding protein